MKERGVSESSLAAKMRVARGLFPQGGPVYITHEGRESVSAPDFLLKAGAAENLINNIFSPSGELRFSPDSTDLYTLPPVQLLEYMLAVTTPLYNAAQKSLGEINWFGYNNHDIPHIRSVAVNTLRLLEQAGYSADIQRRGVIAAVGHDLGNIINRDTHSLISPAILERVFPKLHEYPTQWRMIRRAMELHDGEIYDGYMEQWAHLSSDERLEKMMKTFGPEALALLIADKVDVGRHRLNDKALNKAAVDAHSHSEVNVALETERLEVNRLDTKRFDWDLVVDPEVRPYEQAERPGLSNLVIPDVRSSTGFSIYASPRTRKSAEDSTPDASKVIRLFLQKHTSRNSVAIQSLLALFSQTTTQIDNVQIRFLAGGQVMERYSISRSTLDSDLSYFKDRSRRG